MSEDWNFERLRIDDIANPFQPALELVQLGGSQKAIAFPVWQFPNGAYDGLGTVPKVLLTFLQFKIGWFDQIVLSLTSILAFCSQLFFVREHVCVRAPVYVDRKSVV